MNHAVKDIQTINDAIEVHQCKLIIDEYPQLFAHNDYQQLNSRANKVFGSACQFLSQSLESDGLMNLYESVEAQYLDEFWDLLITSRCLAKLSGRDLCSLLVKHSTCIPAVLKRKQIVSQYPRDISDAMRRHPVTSAQIVINSIAVQTPSGKRMSLPRSLSHEDFERFMCAYIESNCPHIDHLRIISSWPSSANSTYCPSYRVRAAADKRLTELQESLFSEVTALTQQFGVRIDGDQTACKKYIEDGNAIIASYGREWLCSYTDYPTILTNFIHVFNFTGNDGLLFMPAHAHEESTVIQLFRIRAINEYRRSIAGDMRESICLLSLMAYRNLLKDIGLRLEDALEWAVNEYFPDEYGLTGLSISLPREGASAFDKCKSMGTEIERVAKAYCLFTDCGTIDEAHFKHLSFQGFESIPSLESDKYCISGPEFESVAWLLFADQSPLAFPNNSECDEQEFFLQVASQSVTRSNYADCYQKEIDFLEEKGFVVEQDSALLLPTKRAGILYRLWHYGAMTRSRHANELIELMESLREEQYIKYDSHLFTPDEARYLNYSFNNHISSNDIALRNKYDHATANPTDPDSEEYETDYCRFLMVLVALILKINDELMAVNDAKGLLELIDWPLVGPVEQSH